jgi:uncharacterized protein (DUF885 family)
MKLRSLAAFLVLLGVGLVAPPLPAQDTPASAQNSSLASRRKALSDFLDKIWQENLSDNPEFASTIGDKRYNDRLTDYSVATYNQHLARDRAYIPLLAEIDTSGMTDQEVLSKELMIRQLVQEQEESSFKPWEMPVNQFYGIHSDLPRLVPQLSFTNTRDYDDYIARLKAIPTAFQQITDNMLTGVDDHRVPPKYLLEKVLVQVNNILAQKPEDSPFALPLKNFPAAIPATDQTRIHDQVLAAISKQVYPAYQRFAKFLEGVYIPAGRTDPGIWALPDGDAYYAFLVKQTTTTDLTPAQIHQTGLDEVAKDEAEMLAIAKKLGFSSIVDLRAAVKANPNLHPASAQALLDLYRTHIDQMRAKLPDLFGRLPKANLVVEAVPDYIAKDQAEAYYEPGTADGSRPGKVFVNTYDFAHRSVVDVEATAYHEGLPGHHLQGAIAEELTGLPEFRKYSWYIAYGEGWGLYSERLGKDVGFYQDPYSDFGRLEADIFRAIRLVVDTGVHSQHWSRQQMIDYFHAHSGSDDAEINADTDRYIAWPAQALGYKIGQLKILELRTRAQQALGAKFDIRAFHDQVIDSGALPLDVLVAKINAWIASQK